MYYFKLDQFLPHSFAFDGGITSYSLFLSIGGNLSFKICFREEDEKNKF